jgi:hypothetical protein
VDGKATWKLDGRPMESGWKAYGKWMERPMESGWWRPFNGLQLKSTQLVGESSYFIKLTMAATG